MDDIIIKIIGLVITVAITLIMRYGIPYMKEILEQSKLSGVMEWVGQAVDAAEQTIKASGSGVEKKAIVTKFLKEILEAKKISISDTQLDTLIEAAVYAINANKEAAANENKQ